MALLCAKMTCARIIKMFKRKMLLLWDHLTVCIRDLLTDILSHKYSHLLMPTSLSQGIGLRERAPGMWSLEHVLLGFSQMNCSHNGVHLGQMLFNVLNRLRVVHKVRIPTSVSHWLIVSCYRLVI
jgi:hypothetical protein